MYICCKHHHVCLGLAKTLYIRCLCGILSRELTKYTVICSVYIRFWPTLCVFDVSTKSKQILKCPHIGLAEICTSPVNIWRFACQKYVCNTYARVVLANAKHMVWNRVCLGLARTLYIQWTVYKCRVGQNRIFAPYMTVHLVISLTKTPYIQRIYRVLANPIHTVYLAGKSTNKRSDTVYIYGYGQPCICSFYTALVYERCRRAQVTQFSAGVMNVCGHWSLLLKRQGSLKQVLGLRKQQGVHVGNLTAFRALCVHFWEFTLFGRWQEVASTALAHQR